MQVGTGRARRPSPRNRMDAGIASPYGLALLSSFVFLVSWLFPASVYTRFVHEPDLLFLDPMALVYFSVCVIALLGGVWTAQCFGSSGSRTSEENIGVSNSVLYLATPLALSIVLCLLYLEKVRTQIDFVSMLASRQGQAIKAAQALGQINTGHLPALPILLGSVWWASYRSRQLKMASVDRWVCRTFLACAFVLVIIAFFATADRGSQMTLLAGLFVVWLYGRSRNPRATTRGLLLVGSTAAASVVAVFASLAFLRGDTTTDSLLGSILGYSAASYNRLAALLSGQMSYLYRGRGVFLFPYLNDRHRLNDILPIAQYMGWPPFLELWRSQFSSVASAGLNPAYIWSSAFGYLYSDLGWGALLYLYLVGVMIGFSWMRFKAGGTIALVIYPFMAFWILFWPSAANLFDFNLVGLLEASFLLLLWDKLWLRKAEGTAKSWHARARRGLLAGLEAAP